MYNVLKKKTSKKAKGNLGILKFVGGGLGLYTFL